jgi:hypothetical protein
MRTLKLFLSLALVSVAIGCGDDTGTFTDMSAADLSVSHDLRSSGDMAFASSCGRPGDTGNSKGVGQFCMTSQDCTGTASFCTAGLASPPTFFCTILGCTMGADPKCGENTTCECQGACACVPNSCLGPSDM